MASSACFQSCNETIIGSFLQRIRSITLKNNVYGRKFRTWRWEVNHLLRVLIRGWTNPHVTTSEKQYVWSFSNYQCDSWVDDEIQQSIFSQNSHPTYQLKLRVPESVCWSQRPWWCSASFSLLLCFSPMLSAATPSSFAAWAVRAHKHRYASSALLRVSVPSFVDNATN
jgi:ABC-type spermidine/putrescine transport system permease subunit II